MKPVYGPGVWLLAAGQTLAYGVYFYIFAGMILYWRDALGWGDTVLAAGPVISTLIAAALAPAMGRTVDGGHAGRLLTFGAVVGAGGLALLAVAATPAVYLAAWATLGVAQGATLYEVCFALLVRRYGAEARGAITRVTLVAGFASTIAFPAYAAVASAYGWRAAVWLAAGVALGAVVPLNVMGVRALRPRLTDPPPPPRGNPRAMLRLGRFWLLAALFALTNLGHWMVISFLLPVLTEQGLSHGVAVLAASCIGPAQVLGRLALLGAEARVGARLGALLSVGGLVLGAALLWVAGAGAPVAIAFAVVQGASIGVMTILRPVLVAEALGRAGYGSVAGMLAIPSMLATAAAPLLGAVLLAQGGTGLFCAVALGLALAALVIARRLPLGQPM